MGVAGSRNLNTWYKKDLGDGMTAITPMEEIKQVFLQFFQARGGPPDMAVFTRLESEGRLHCTAMAYFSPGAREVARSFGAVPCERPERMGLSLLAGSELCWPVLFSGRE